MSDGGNFFAKIHFLIVTINGLSEHVWHYVKMHLYFFHNVPLLQIVCHVDIFYFIGSEQKVNFYFKHVVY
jgi:hypothetical protein